MFHMLVSFPRLGEGWKTNRPLVRPYHAKSLKVDGATNTDTDQEINQVTVSLTDELISEHETDRPISKI